MTGAASYVTLEIGKQRGSDSEVRQHCSIDQRLAACSLQHVGAALLCMDYSYWPSKLRECSVQQAEGQSENANAPALHD